MSEANKDYELEMLKMVVNQYLDKSTSFTEQSLNEIETNRDQFVWDIVTKIYQESGRKVELSFVRDIVDSRIKAIKHQLAEKARHIAEQKAQQAAKIEAHRIAAQKAQQAAKIEAEEARRIAEQKAQQAAEIETEEARRTAEQEAQFLSKVTDALGKFGGDESKAKIFVRVREIRHWFNSVKAYKSWQVWDSGLDSLKGTEANINTES
ncbi:MAG: hypothetical protein ACKO24_11800 [Leptolyngbyaceae cyanobacterium]